MATLVCFHAHPDDEAIATGGTIARAAAEGHRVVLVVATGGEWGEIPADLAPGETLVERRRAEVDASAAVLGISRVAWLGYADSGMTGWEQNDLPGAFIRAPLEEAAGRLAAILREEDAEVLTVYDWHGNYGHPDHIRVHQVGHRAAALARTPRLFEATMNRTEIIRSIARVAALTGPGAPPTEDPGVEGPSDDGNPMGMEEHEITLAVDVRGYIGRKREALLAHRSQVSDVSFFATMPPERFAEAFGTEWYIEVGITPPGVPIPGWFW